MGQYVTTSGRTIRLALVFLFGCAVTLPAIAETVVTTYVTKTQEERESTRFTLTEWLRIKERTKMMDVWLAMFSNPKEDKFRPELNLIYGVTRGDMTTSSVQGASEDAKLASTQLRGQFWLTNIFTGSSGVRLVNIDFGIEAYHRQSEPFVPATSLSTLAARRGMTQYYAADFRLFGKSIQDSSLVAKIGKYTTKTGLPTLAGLDRPVEASGRFYGGELQLYLLRFLGLEGNYLHFAPTSFIVGENELSGAYYDYMAYIEVSLLRIMGGVFQEDWSFKTAAGTAKTSESGLIFGAKIQL